MNCGHHIDPSIKAVRIPDEFNGVMNILMIVMMVLRLLSCHLKIVSAE